MYRQEKRRKGVMNGEILYLGTKSSPGDNAAQSGHLEAMLAFNGSNKTKTRTKHTTLSTVVAIRKRPLKPDAFVLKRFYKIKRRTRSVQNAPSRPVTPVRASISTSTGYWFKRSSSMGLYTGLYRTIFAAEYYGSLTTRCLEVIPAVRRYTTP